MISVSHLARTISMRCTSALDLGLDTCNFWFCVAGCLLWINSTTLVFLCNLDFGFFLNILIFAVWLTGFNFGSTFFFLFFKQADIQKIFFNSLPPVAAYIGYVHGGDSQADSFQIRFLDINHIFCWSWAFWLFSAIESCKWPSMMGRVIIFRNRSGGDP